MSVELIGAIALALAGLFAFFAFQRVRARAEARDSLAFEQAVAENRHIPQTLHPVIDPDRCIGSFSCLKVCPEGDILGAVDGKAALISASSCIGHGKCAVECPVDAIKLVFGTSERGVDLPEVDENFQTSRAGLHVVGELGGMGLIKNAIIQGLQCAKYLGETLKPTTTKGLVDVAIVGSGPAGMATALGLKKAGLSFRLLEREAKGGTIAHYPRQKVVMTERVEVPFIGKFGKPLISKEELLEEWDRALESAGVTVETDTAVITVEGDDDRFAVKTSKGLVAARKVVLAIGRHGTPRKLGVPGEDLPKLAYRMIDPQQYEGARVLVVGGGDSALEAAIQIVEETEAEVALSYRQNELGRARDANKRRFRELVAQGRIHAFLPSQVTDITETDVGLNHNGRVMRLRNDFIIAAIGGELPAAFLKDNRIDIKRFHGEEKNKARAKRGSAKGAEGSDTLALTLFTIAVVVVAAMTVLGWHYYTLPLAERRLDPAHPWLKPAGPYGHGVGIVATFVMMLNFLYAVRKRVRAFKGAGPIRNWLTFHQFVGFLAPTVVAFHAAFQSNNALASATAISLSVVVLTGAIGRYIFSLVPSSEGKVEALGELTARWERLKVRVGNMTSSTTQVGQLNALIEKAVEKPQGSLLGQLITLPFARLVDAGALRKVRTAFQSRHHHRDFVEAYHRLRSLQVQVGFFKSLKRLMSMWRIFHVVLAVLLVVMITAHIAVSMYLGYLWVFR